MRPKGNDKSRSSGDPIVVLPHPLDRDGYAAPHTSCDGQATSDFAVAHSIWMSRAKIGDGTILTWNGEQGAEVVYVLSGRLESEHGSCDADGCLFVPPGQKVKAVASGEVDLLHYGANEGEPAEGTSAGSAFTMNSKDAHRFVSHGDDGREFVLDFFTDGTDLRTTCAVFNVSVDGETFAAPHSHSRDEIIHVLEGEIKVGTVRIGAGASVGVGHDIRYSFRTVCPTKFLNFRLGDSYITARKGESSPETMAARRDGIALGQAAPLD